MSFHFCWKYWCTKAGVLKYWSAEVLVHWSSHRCCFVKEDVHNNFAKFTGKHLCRSLCFKKSLEVCNVIKKETLAQVFSCEFCEISQNNFFSEHTSRRLLLVRDGKTDNMKQFTEPSTKGFVLKNVFLKNFSAFSGKHLSILFE